MTTAMTEDSKPSVFTIPAGTPFVDALAAGILRRAGDDPGALPRLLVLLPTRRACRALREAFLRHREGRALLLPRLVPLGDLDEDEMAIAEAGEAALGGAATGCLDAPLAIPALRRQLLLTRLVLALDWEDTTPDQAARLAEELAKLLDQVRTERLSFEGLRDLVPEDYADHWQRTLDFLNIVTENWPAILAGEGCVDAAERRNMVLETQARAWRDKPPSHAVIAAGSTGSIPTTAELLGVVARLPQGCVVLPGLDADADHETWEEIGRQPTHPQNGLARLLERLGVERRDVAEWEAAGVPSTPPARAALLGTALSPANVPGAGEPPPGALDGVTRIDCPGPREEAGVVALVMRQALETPRRTAALVTPDRGLARQVAAELRRWKVEVDDSAGLPLAQTPPGAFLKLTARMAAEDFAPVPLLAALKHPLAGGGMAPARLRASVRRLEIDALRGPRPGGGLAGLSAALDAKASRHSVLLAALEAAAQPYAKALKAKKATFRKLLEAHLEMAESLAATDAETGAQRLWAGEAGEAAAVFIAELDEASAILSFLPGADYAALLDVLMAGRVVRPRHGRHPRLHIWGLLEARLQHADVVVLSGLNEGTWPPEAEANPWMSRPMLDAFGLPPPERRIGLTAHDFVQALAAPTVVLTRAARVEGTPTVPSRWLLRLDNLLEGHGLEGTLGNGAPWLAWLGEIDAPAASDPGPVPPPAPRPPLKSRPRKISVTRVETWIRDAYSVYAEQILRLRPLDPLDADPAAAERGTIVHTALEQFQNAYPGLLPDDAYDKLLEIGDEVFADYISRPGVRAFWWPRFQRIAGWFVKFERGRRASGLIPLAAEVDGRLEIAGPSGPFLLKARADRIDRDDDGGLAIVDYKTGQAPSWPQVTSGLVPQLPLEAAIAAAGGFEGVPEGAVGQLAYVSLPGGRAPGKFKPFPKDIGEAASEALAGLERLVAAYDDPATPYRSRARPMFESRFDTYDHLARVREWLALGGEGE